MKSIITSHDIFIINTITIYLVPRITQFNFHYIYISLHPLFLFDKTWIKNKRKTLISWRLIGFMLLLSTLPVRSDSTDCSAPCFRSTMIRVTFNLTQISDLIPISIDLQFIWLKRLANCSTPFFFCFSETGACVQIRLYVNKKLRLGNFIKNYFFVFMDF